MLLPELDHKATIKRVKRFFEKGFQTLQIWHMYRIWILKAQR